MPRHESSKVPAPRGWPPAGAFDWQRPRAFMGDLMERHLDEAGFLIGMRRGFLAAADRTLVDLERVVDHRLAAHVDALVLGGAAVADAVLMPALDDAKDPDRVAAAACVLVAASVHADARPEALEKVLALLAAGAAGPGAAIADALIATDQQGWETDVAARLAPPAAAPVRAALLPILAARGVALDWPVVEAALGAGDPALAVAALGALRAVHLPHALAAVRQALAAESVKIRAAAVLAGVRLGQRPAWETCRIMVRMKMASPTEVGDGLFLALAMGGGDDDHKLLCDLASRPDLRRPALWSLGFCGRRRAADLAVSLLADAALAPMAADALATITGASIPLVDDGADDGEAGAGGADPVAAPDVPAITAWWAQNRDRFGADARYLRGQPFSAQQLAGEIGGGPLHRRGPWLEELGIRTRGQHVLHAGAHVAQQRRALALLPGAPFFDDAFDTFFTEAR